MMTMLFLWLFGRVQLRRSRTPFYFISKQTTIFEVKIEPCNVELYHTHKAPAQSTGLSSTTSIEYLY
ncbi:unnamed protein product [Rhizophagus irregularis]|nr:unnamed protein product [Rhizophagus irregularis]CAB5374980.1 unnamed protein product [Rhizophagus irregularis]